MPWKTSRFSSRFLSLKDRLSDRLQLFFSPHCISWSTLQAVCLLGYSDIRRVWRYAPAHRPAYAAERATRRSAWTAFHDAIAAMRAHPWEWADPFGWPNPVSKAQTRAMAPRVLVELAVSCRDPQPDGQGGFGPCGACFKCRGD